ARLVSRDARRALADRRVLPSPDLQRAIRDDRAGCARRAQGSGHAREHARGARRPHAHDRGVRCRRRQPRALARLRRGSARALAEDLDRVEPAFGVGARVRPWAGPCWPAHLSPYVRAQLSVAAASHFGSNYDLLAGAGHWGRVTRWLHWFAEVDTIARVGEYT